MHSPQQELYPSSFQSILDLKGTGKAQIEEYEVLLLVLEIELVIVYYVIACARDYIERLIVIALDTIIPGSRVIHKRRHSSRHPRRPRAIKYSSFPILYILGS